LTLLEVLGNPINNGGRLVATNFQIRKTFIHSFVNFVIVNFVSCKIKFLEI